MQCRSSTGRFGLQCRIGLPGALMGAAMMWWTRAWKWERIGEAVDLRLFRKRMWAKSVMWRIARLQTVAAFFFFFLCMRAFMSFWSVFACATSAWEWFWMHIMLHDCVYISNLLQLRQNQFPTHHCVGLVIAAIMITHRLTHMFVRVELFFFLYRKGLSFKVVRFHSMISKLNFLWSSS